MRRRRHLRGDSLDLLLDTICNTFGGILFIAILVIIMLQMSGQPSSEQDVDRESVEIRQQQLTTKQNNLNQELLRLKQTLLGQAEVIARMAPQEHQSLLEQRSIEQAKLASLANTKTMLEKTLDNAKAEKSRMDNEAQQVLESIVEHEAKIESLETELSQKRNDRQQVLRTTTVRPAGFKQEVIVVIEYDRLYIWHLYNKQGDRLGLNTNDFIVLDETLSDVNTTPNPVAGIPLENTIESNKKVRQRLRQFSHQTSYLAVIVRPDSFDSYHLFRDICVDLNFEYRLVPTEEDKKFVDRGGSGGRVQ